VQGEKTFVFAASEGRAQKWCQAINRLLQRTQGRGGEGDEDDASGEDDEDEYEYESDEDDLLGAEEEGR